MDSLTLHRKARLKQLLATEPFAGNQAELARRAGLSKGRINQLIDPKLPFGERSARRLALNLDLSPFYFEYGYEKSPHIPMVEDGLANALGVRPIPIISAAQASNWVEVIEDFEPDDAQGWLFTDLQVSSGTFAFGVPDESMRGEFNPGDMVIIDPGVMPLPGDFVVATCGADQVSLRKYRLRRVDSNDVAVYDLVPLNDDYPVISSVDQATLIVGTMVEQRKFRRARA